MSKQLIVCGVTVKQDDEGRYCLNDLHKAAGEERRHDTREFLDRDSTKELVQELERKMTEKSVNKIRGRTGGTFVVKQLVYAYAMWISPKFHLEVIEAYDRLATEGVAVHKSAAEDLLANPLKYIRSVIEQAERIKAERDQLAAENAFMHDELHLVTMDEYRSLTHRYFDPSYRQRLQWAARKLAKDRGITLERAP